MKRIAIVTGASSGIGKEFFLSVTQKADELDEIWVVARGEEKLKQLQPLSPAIASRSSVQISAQVQAIF